MKRKQAVMWVEKNKIPLIVGLLAGMLFKILFAIALVTTIVYVVWKYVKKRSGEKLDKGEGNFH